MNKLVPIFAATVLSISGAAFAEGSSGSIATPSNPSAQADGSQAQDAKPQGFVLIQRNIFVPVDAQGNAATDKAVVIDKQGFVTMEQMEAAAQGAQSSNDEDEGTAAQSAPEAQSPTAGMDGSTRWIEQRGAIGEGPVVNS